MPNKKLKAVYGKYREHRYRRKNPSRKYRRLYRWVQYMRHENRHCYDKIISLITDSKEHIKEKEKMVDLIDSLNAQTNFMSEIMKQKDDEIFKLRQELDYERKLNSDLGNSLRQFNRQPSPMESCSSPDGRIIRITNLQLQDDDSYDLVDDIQTYNRNVKTHFKRNK